MGCSGATLMAAADISVDSGSIARLLKLPGGDEGDSPEVFLEDILAAGKYINNRPLAERAVDNAPHRVKELLDWGLRVKHVMHTPGHRYPRGVGTTGREIVRVQNKQFKRRAIKVIENTCILESLKTEGSQWSDWTGFNVRRICHLPGTGGRFGNRGRWHDLPIANRSGRTDR